MRVAISQPIMHWDIEGNLREVTRGLSEAARRGAELVAFPELTLTGFHTKVPGLLDPDVLERALGRVAAHCRALGIAAALGMPTPSGGERPYNATVILDAEGRQQLCSPKMRLMPPGEPMVFEAGTGRPIMDHAEGAIAVVMCREIVDREALREELSGRARIILWPGSMARPARPADDPDAYAANAMDLAREQNAWVLHSNWAVNVEAPKLRDTGKSLVISPQGEPVLEAPAREPGLLLAWERALDAAWVPAA